jgi:hypothetical protein
MNNTPPEVIDRNNQGNIKEENVNEPRTRRTGMKNKAM